MMKHYLTPNHAKQLPWHVVSLDTETASVSEPQSKIQIHKLILGCMVYRRYWVDKDRIHRSRVQTYRFETLEELLVPLKFIVLKPKRRTYLYAHNANFDFGIIYLRDTTQSKIQIHKLILG